MLDFAELLRTQSIAEMDAINLRILETIYESTKYTVRGLGRNDEEWVYGPRGVQVVRNYQWSIIVRTSNTPKRTNIELGIRCSSTWLRTSELPERDQAP